MISVSMSNVIKTETNLAVSVFISVAPKPAKGFARIKVNDSPQHAFDAKHNFEVLFDETTAPHLKEGVIPKLSSKEVARIFKWVELNLTALLDHWHAREISSRITLNKLQPLID